MNDSTDKSVILIVDDDAESRDVLAELLTKEAYTVARAENGRDALDYLSRSIPSLIMDLMMPTMSGWEFRERQRADLRLNSLPVVVTSASGLAPEIDADALIPKPIDFALLMSAVRNCLARRNAIRTDDGFGFSSCFASNLSVSINSPLSVSKSTGLIKRLHQTGK
jgi:CheY-like chemotaxis protein